MDINPFLEKNFVNIIILPYWHFCYWIQPIYLHVSTAEGARNERKMDLIHYLVLWSLMERPRKCLTPTNPSSMAEIQGVTNLNGHYICLPYAVEWKLQPWRLSLKRKSTLAPSSPSSPLPPSYFILTTTCHWIMGSEEAVTEALTPQISSSIYVKEKKSLS